MTGIATAIVMNNGPSGDMVGGVETVTESSSAEGATRIREHVRAMHERLKNGQPIHVCDPLFAEIFAHASQIVMVIEDTPKGVRVRETSSDPYVTKLIRAHADVVSKFIAHGKREMGEPHPVPER